VTRTAPLLAAAALVAAACGGSPAAPRGAAARADALTRASAPGGGGYPAARARAQARVRGAAIPLPPGGNFNGIRWEQASGVLPAATIDAVLQYNAACQWLRSASVAARRPLALRVLRSVPRWPAFRGTPAGAAIARVTAQTAAGGGSDARAALASCEASHAREVAYAASRGLTPSS
jgi:hypothetical protein